MTHAMTHTTRWLLLAGALFAASCGQKGDETKPTQSAGPVATRPADGKWLETVAATPEGGFVMGNPNARVKLVEYSSMTCPHCAAFATEGVPALKANYIASGDVSLEMRNFIRDPVDVTASLIARCNGAGPFFKMTEQIFADQRGWMQKVIDADQATQQKLGAMAPDKQYRELARISGLDRFALERGVPEAKLSQCLADLKARDQLVQMNKTATDTYNLSGTPTFLVNGKVVENAYDWASLEPKLKAALGR